jgi:hypothetical protein
MEKWIFLVGIAVANNKNEKNKQTFSNILFFNEIKLCKTNIFNKV